MSEIPTVWKSLVGFAGTPDTMFVAARAFHARLLKIVFTLTPSVIFGIIALLSLGVLYP